MTTALLIIDVQQALCSGEHATFDVAHNGVTRVPAAQVQFAA